MCRWTRCRASAAVGWFLLAAAALAAPTSSAAALTPNSPEVRRAIDAGIKYLESDAARDTRVGAGALVGIALLKRGAPPDHPKIAAAVAQIQQGLEARDPAKVGFEIYSTGLAIVFLVELDPGKHQSDIDCLMKSLQLCQKPHGGWGYPHLETGDTSMTQYGVLSSWEAAQVGMPMPVDSIEGVTSWLLKTQDPSGGFGYQGALGSGNALVGQSDVKQSTTAAGLGSLYICATLLGIGPKIEKSNDNLPAALKEVKSKEEERNRSKVQTRIDGRLVREAQARGTQWMQANYKIDPPGWTHYYLYALERYMSFMELSERKQEREPRWYDDGARYLIKTQAADGSWQSAAGAVPDTAFAVLFLLRSMKKSLEKAYTYGDGTLVGGRGLPKETGRVEVRGGQVVARPLLGPAEGLLAALENQKIKDSDAAIELLAALPAPDVEAFVAKHGDKIRRLVGNESPETRLAAVRALGKTRDLDEVPVLIYALTDPDSDVVRAAHNALLRISRNPTAVHLPEQFTEENRRLAIEKWKTWYRVIRPNANLK